MFLIKAGRVKLSKISEKGEELSFLVGAHRVSITKAMKTLKESGKVRQDGRTLILPESSS